MPTFAPQLHHSGKGPLQVFFPEINHYGNWHICTKIESQPFCLYLFRLTCTQATPTREHVGVAWVWGYIHITAHVHYNYYYYAGNILFYQKVLLGAFGGTYTRYFWFSSVADLAGSFSDSVRFFPKVFVVELLVVLSMWSISGKRNQPDRDCTL